MAQIPQKNSSSEDPSQDNGSIIANTVQDYSKQGEDVHDPPDSSDFSQLYYLYKNDTIYQSNSTINFLISTLWDSNLKGFNESNGINAKKRTGDNMLMILTLLEYHEANIQAEYITYAEGIFNFEYNYLWDNQSNLFLSYCDANGSNAIALINSTDNALALVALLKLYEITTNQTYLEIVNLAYDALNAKFYDSTNGGYYRSNKSGDTTKLTYDNLLVTLALTELYRSGHFSSEVLVKAENTMDTLISHYLNGTKGFFSAGDNTWDNPVEEKSALTNALAVYTLISLYEVSSNQTYLDIALQAAEFIDAAFWDSTGLYLGYNSTVNWDGTVTLNSTKYLETNAWIMKAFLKLFEITYNSTFYLNAINISRFCNTYLLDYNMDAFNYSINFADSSLSSLKSTAANAWAIQALLGFRYPLPYLTRANTTMTYLYNYLYSNGGFDELTMYDWSSLSSQIILEYPFYITLADLFRVVKTTSANLQIIYTLLELAEETHLTNYISLANNTMYFLNRTAFNQAFSVNASGLATQTQREYETEVNAWGILALLKLYEKTNDNNLLEMANSTWYFLKNTLWDTVNYGYNTSTLNNLSKDLIANCLMIWANLAIINSTYPIFNGIRTTASTLVNQTLRAINLKMWDSTNFGFFSNASKDWSPALTGENAKGTYENCFMIQTLIKYNEIYSNHPNQTLYDEYIDNATEFLIRYLLDKEVGGFYYVCHENGSSPETDKHTYINNWAALTFLNLYKYTNNFTYYLVAEETNNFINTYLWDFEYGGYFHSCSKEGLPQTFGVYPTGSGSILISFKFAENQIISILMLTRLSAVKRIMNFPLIVDLEFQPERLDRGALILQLSLKIIDIEGNPISQANLSVSMNGYYESLVFEKFYGFAQKQSLKNQQGLNEFTGILDISKFSGDFHLTILAYNTSMAVSWISISKERGFDIYLSKVFSIINSLNLLFWDKTYGGYIRRGAIAASTPKYAYDNWMSILALLEYYNATGLNLLYNLTTFDVAQLLWSYISNIFNFINTSLRFSQVNQSAIAFFSGAHSDGTSVSREILSLDNALAIITLLKYYQITNDSVYLEMANNTWAYLNSTLWDSEYLGYKHVNGTFGNQTKYTIDNIWAIMANLAIYNTTQINSTIRNSAMNMANLTLNLLNQHLWDNEYSGFFTAFNGSTWQPFNSTIECKKADVNALAIQALIQFAQLAESSKREAYILLANNTFLFMNNYLKDSQFLGYFRSCDRNGTNFNTNKTLAENSQMISALLDLYSINNNYTYYQLAEETIFFLDRYFKSPLTTVYHNFSSRVGAITYDIVHYVPLECYPNFIFIRGLVQADLKRQALNYPLVIDEISIDNPRLGQIQNVINMTVQVFDSNNNPIEGATVIGVVFGQYNRYIFTHLQDNIYYCLIDVSDLAGSHKIDLLAFKEGYSAGSKEYTYIREFPIYVQKAYETLIALLVQLWSDSKNIFYNDQYSNEYGSKANLLAIKAFMDFVNLGGNIIWGFDWSGNRTFQTYLEIAAQNLGYFLNSSTIQVDSANISGYISETEYAFPVNRTTVADNALAILTFLDLYNQTGDSVYLELANSTWLYLNATFWDPVYWGYFTDNSTTNTNKSLYDNCLAILANIAINETSAINPFIRAQAFNFASNTFTIMNQSLWDNINGTYYSQSNRDWSNQRTRNTDANALMILTLLKFYSHSLTQSNYLYMANITSEIFIKHFYDAAYGGFYPFLRDNFTPPVLEFDLAKYSSDNAWAILALTELYRITRNTTYYFKAEDTMNFINSRMANHYNQYLNVKIGDINGYWDIGNQSGFVYGKYNEYFVGSLDSNALIVRALLSLYTLANQTLPWLNTTVQILPASSPALGEYCNLTISIMNEGGAKVLADLNITMVGWTRFTDTNREDILQQLEYEYDPSTQEYKIKNINLSKVEDIYFAVFVKNSNYAAWWNVYYIHRVESSITGVWAVDADYIYTEDYWQYTIGEDTIIIESYYSDFENSQPIPWATVNYTVYFPNASIWFSELVVTNSSGWTRLVFGPIPNVAENFGQYFITIFGSHVNNSIYPKTWYASTWNNITLNIDFGVSIPFFYPLEPYVAQGDTVLCNVTIKHRMLSNLTVNILIYAEGVLIPTEVTRNISTGYNIFLIEVEVDERTPPLSHRIKVNVSFENKVIRATYFFVAILSAAIIRNFYAPTWTATDDVRYAVIQIEHRKLHETSNLSIQVNSPALQVNPYILTLPELTDQDYYIPLYVKDNVPYGVYSGEIIIQRVNYTLKYEGASLTFQIEIKPSIEVETVHLPSTLGQNQQSMTTIRITNNKVSATVVRIIGYGDGFNYFERNITINPAETKVINTPIIYYTNPWDTGNYEYSLEIYYLNNSSEFSLVDSTTFQITITYTINNILLGFILPSAIIAIIVIWILWQREKKKRARKKLK
ncbi:MAG TPA: AGE family epimerase/isomerase [Candidatus Deferrimicrobium sp.]|nr:AGE family epimerase/isomerase [Candidatus Deferrimicrobium sp.]